MLRNFNLVAADFSLRFSLPAAVSLRRLKPCGYMSRCLWQPNLKMTIRRKILFWFLLPSILITIVTAVFCYFHTRTTVKQNIFDQLEIASSELQKRVNIFLQEKRGRTLDFSSDSFIREYTEELGQGNQLKGLGETGEVYIVNKDKLMITESRFIKDAVFKQVVDTEGVRAAFENGEGMTGIYPNYIGIPILGVSRYIEDVDWVILAEKEVSEAFVPVARLRNFTIIMGIAGVIVVVTIAIFLAGGITRPINELVEGTERILKGDLTFKIETEAKDEIGRLAASFNDMSFQLGESKKQLQDYALNLEKKVEDKTKEIKRGKEYIENLIETAQDAIICIDEKGMIKVWNQSAEKIFGYSKGEITGQPATTLIPEKYKKEHQEGLERFLKKGEGRILGKTVEVSGLTKEGIEIPVEISLSSQKAEEERYSFTAIIRDITQKKKVEDEHKRMQDDLRYKNKELEEIIHIASHDLRSPLVNIHGFSRELEHAFKQVNTVLSNINIDSAVKDDLAPILKKDIPEALQYIQASASKMHSLLNGLLRISRLIRAKLTIKRLDMNKLMSNVIGTFEYEIKRLGVKLQVDELPSCMGDEMHINQVFSNLLNNALKYLDPARRGIIRISGTRQLVYCMEDNGIGIAAEHRNKIYEMFYRLNPNNGGGEGLGLAIVCRILDRHGGRIWVESNPGRGSKFFVFLPR